ncbi:hypothetical protein [Halorubrum kocurii]|uniref:Uncharacterized protein n=1 Tax=Halorubrum kocurii JCM 14978 TaxID=1230456 RepID=M0NS55_9EURY|nr:hypothetical protein [Halorubrum kocurii]EMA60049.1 hypothetical protein C468_13731 [Halorubrum kocurii JCM 14978]
MSDGSDRWPITDGYVVPIAGLIALLFALMAGLTAPRALSGDPTDALLPIGFALGALAALRLRQRYGETNAEQDGDAADDEAA